MHQSLSLRGYGIILSIIVLHSCNTASSSVSSQPRRKVLLVERDLNKQQGEKGKSSTKKQLSKLLPIRGEVGDGCRQRSVEVEKQGQKHKVAPVSKVAVRTKRECRVVNKEKGPKNQVGGVISSNTSKLNQRSIGIKVRNNALSKVPELHKERDRIKAKQVDKHRREETVATKPSLLELSKRGEDIKCISDVFCASTPLVIESLPVEILATIFSCLRFEEMLLVREVNQFFYWLTTGYNRVGVVGIENKPKSHKLVKSWYVICYVINFKSDKNFKQGIWNHQTIPSFIFYQYMHTVSDMPEVYWSCLPDTHVMCFMLHTQKVTVRQTIELGKSLIGSKVRELNLSSAQLGDEEIEALSRELAKTNVEVLILQRNHIGPKGAEGLFKNLQGSKVKKVQLNVNKVKSEGLEHIGKYISRTAVQSLGVACNDIEAEVIKEFLRSLGKDTGLKEIYFGGNKLTKEDWKFVDTEYPHIKFS